jgi:hypothetical protein
MCEELPGYDDWKTIDRTHEFDEQTYQDDEEPILMIKRFGTDRWNEVEEQADGEYVLFQDYQQLLEALRQLEHNTTGVDRRHWADKPQENDDAG